MNLHCPFERLAVAGTHACARGLAVTRRNGAGVDCSEETAHSRCATAQAFFAQVGGEAFGEVEDLTQVPHSTLLKIQIGGLAGVAGCLDLPQSMAVDNMGELIERAGSRLGDLDHDALVAAMRAAKARRKRH